LKKARLILENVECSPLYRSQYGSLSDGEKQRVLIARALMSSPTLLALDEPCSGLDIGAREAFLKFLTRIMKVKGPTVIFATHRIDEIVKTVSHIMIIRGGQVVSSGAKNSVLTGRNLTRAFGVKISVIQHGGRYQAFSS
jgi:iron complex transport system ATP-binding protein